MMEQAHDPIFTRSDKNPQAVLGVSGSLGKEITSGVGLSNTLVLQQSSAPFCRRGVFFDLGVYRFRRTSKLSTSLHISPPPSFISVYQKHTFSRKPNPAWAYSLLFVKNLEVLDSFNS